MTKELHADVIMSEDLFKQVEAHVEAEPMKRIHVKGREQEVMVYKLLGLKGQPAAAEDTDGVHGGEDQDHHQRVSASPSQRQHAGSC